MGLNIQSIYSGISAQVKNFLLKSLPGMNNKVIDLDLSTKWAQNAQNARFEDTPGAVDKRAPVSYYNASAITAAPVTGLYRYYTSGGADLWISTCGTGAYVGTDSNGTFTQIRSALTTGKRHQFVVYQDLLIGSNGYDPLWVYDGDTTNNVTWQLGACKALATTTAGSMGSGTYYYSVTVGSADQWVSGAVSNTVTVAANKSVQLSNIPLGPPGTPARKIYRTKVNGSTLYYLATISDNSTTTYADTIADGAISVTIPSTTDVMPKGALLTLHRERLFISGDPSSPNNIYYSSTYLPHYIQQTTQLTLLQIANDDGDTITGIPIQLGVMVCIKRNSIRILHITSPVSGADPTTWYADDPLAWIGSPAPYSVTQTPSGIVFLGYDHWYIFDGAAAQPIIDEFNTENILAAAYNDTVGYYNNGIFLSAYTDITSAAQFHNRIMRWNFRRQALGIDTWTSATLTGANCFAGRIGDNEDGDLFYGDSMSGYVVKDQNSESVYSLITQADANSGTLSNIFVGGSVNAPNITIGSADAPTAIPNNICIFWDNSLTNPGSGWTEILGYNNNCILITNAVNPLVTDPGVSHTHLLSGSIPTWTGNTVNAGDGNPGAVAAHSHLVSSNGDPATPLPRNTFLRLFKKNSNTTEYQFPAGSIIMYDQASTPTGWISLNSEGLTGYYIALNQGGTQYAFAVSGISVWPTVGATYTNNASTFTITFAPTSGSAGIIYATSSSGDPSPSNGNLTKSAGTGDSTIAYTAWQSQANTLSTPNASIHSHTFDIPTGTSSGSIANSDSGNNCPAFGHDHVVAGQLASVDMDTVNSSPWEVNNVGFNFIKLVGNTSSWDGTVRNAYCLFAGTEAMSNGWTEATATYTGNYLKIISGAPTVSGTSNNSHTHTAGTFTTSNENATWGNGGYRATCYAAPHNHQVTLTASSASCGNPPSVAFRLCYKILGQMATFNDAISVQYTTGTYTSSAQQINAQKMDKLFWNQQISGSSDTIQFYFRSGTTQANCLAASYQGPYTNPNGSDISANTNPTWVQYKIVFTCTDSRVTNPSVYFTGGYAVQYTYLQGASNAETSVNFIYSIGFRNLDNPTADKIYKKISTTHVGSAGSFTFGWVTENASGSMLVSLASNPTYWDSYFQPNAMGKQIDLMISQNDLNPLKIKQMELFYSGMQVVV